MFDYEAYMRIIAETHKSIRHSETTKRFHRASSLAEAEEVLSGVDSTNVHLVIVDNIDFRTTEPNTGASYKDKNYVYFLLKKAEIQNMDIRKAIMTEVEGVYNDITSKMFLDQTLARKQEIESPMLHLDRRSLVAFGIGPIQDGLIGMACQFTIPEAGNFIYNADRWTL